MPSRLLRVLARLSTFLIMLVTAEWLILNVIFATQYIWGIDLLGLVKYAPYISRVDVSAANTLIFFLTGLFLFTGTRRYCAASVSKAELAKIRDPHFPFPSRFKVVLVQLGLLGTVFAFIIAFNRLAGASPEAQHRYDPALLVVPLGAALWSTFAGIAFAYIIVPAIQRLFSFLLRTPSATTSASQDVNSVVDSFASLKKQVTATSDELGYLNEKLGRVESQLDSIGQSPLLLSIENATGAANAAVQAVDALKLAGTDMAVAANTITEATSSQCHEVKTVREDMAILSRIVTQQSQTIAAQITATGQLEHELRATALVIRELIMTSKSLSAEVTTDFRSASEQLRNSSSEIRALTAAIKVSQHSGAQITGSQNQGSGKNSNGAWRWNPLVLIGSAWSKSFGNGRRV